MLTQEFAFKQEIINKIRETVQEFFEKTTILFEIKDIAQSNDVFKIEISSPESSLLIGKKGETLNTLNIILARILQKKLGERRLFQLDINNYQKHKIEYLKNLATTYAQEVIISGTEKSLPPMPSWERKIIHLELLLNPDVYAESIGENQNRHIVIKPKPTLTKEKT